MLNDDLKSSTVLRCNINEVAFSRALFLCRFITGLVMIYLALGSLFFWREWLVNTASFGLPHSLSVAFGLAGLELIMGLVLMLGWHTRISAGAALLLSLICAIIFFAGEYNAVFLALCVLFWAPFGVLLILGPGVISLDYKRSQRQARHLFRGKL